MFVQLMSAKGKHELQTPDTRGRYARSKQVATSQRL